jgi:hypothetical protein
MKKKLLSKRLENLILLQHESLNFVEFKTACLLLTLLSYENEPLVILIDDLLFGIEKYLDNGKRIPITEGISGDQIEIERAINRLTKLKIIETKRLYQNQYKIF